MLENKSGSIYKTRKNGGKVNMDGLYELTNALSNGTIPDHLWPTFLVIGGLQLSYPLLSQEQVKLQTSNLAGTFARPIRIKVN